MRVLEESLFQHSLTFRLRKQAWIRGKIPRAAIAVSPAFGCGTAVLWAGRR